MSAPSNKPRDIKNLKARLGRTITPGTAGTPSVPPGAGLPPGLGGSGIGGGAFPTPGVGSVPPPTIRSSSPGSIPAPGSFPSGIQAPPFARPMASQPSNRPQAQAPAAAAGAPRMDPFGSNAPAGALPQTRKVTLVIDDSAVKDDEIGRRSAGKTMALVGVGLLLGLAAGFGVGNTTDKRHQYAMAVQDGKDIYAKVQAVSKDVEEAKAALKSAVDASTGGPGRKATIDYSSIEKLVAMKRPFSANEFHRRLYRAFGDGVVDDLFDYYNNVNLLWDGFSALGAKTTGAAKRDTLNKSAAATDGLLNTDYGVVFSKNGDALAGALVFLTVPTAQPAAEDTDKKGKGKGKGKGKEDDAPKVKVSSSQGGQEVERTIYMGQDGMKDDAEKYVLMLDKVRSRTILGESANLFGKYRGDLMDLNARMDKTAETQGRLIKELGQVAALKP